MSIATRTGDSGTTSLLYGQRVAKDHPQIELHTYADRDHAFAREGGAHYDAADAAKANGRSLTFFQKVLG